MNVVDKTGAAIDIGDTIEYESKYGITKAMVTKITRKFTHKWNSKTGKYEKIPKTRLSVLPFGRYEVGTSISRLDKVTVINKYEEINE